MKLTRTLGLFLLSGLPVGCGASADDLAPREDLASANQALSGTVAFVETAKAPITYAGNAINFTSKRRVRAVAVQDGFVYVGGDFTITTGSGIVFTNLAKFAIPTTPSSPLILVRDFHPTVNAPVWAIATSSGNVWVGGEFTKINTTSRSGLALLDATTGAPNAQFAANLGTARSYTCPSPCSDPPNYAWGVHALALTSWGRTGQPGNLIVGGNFTTVKGVARSGLASVSAFAGTVSTSTFTTGVSNGFVHTLQPLWDDMYVGGNFDTTTDQNPHSGIFKTDYLGAIDESVSFFNAGPFVADIDIDWSELHVIVGSGSSNSVMAFSLGGEPIWSTLGYPKGDVQAVKYFDGNVYFGFHDGLLADGNSSGKAGDQYKLAAVAADTGNLVTDKTHTGACVLGSTTDNCWAPTTDSKGVPLTTGTGAWGVWALETYADSSGSRLIVGGEVNKWGTVTSPLLTTFGSQ